MEKYPTLADRVREELIDRIKRRELDSQSRLPSEAMLAEEFGVSRATVREALNGLASRGIVVRKHGSGTYVNHSMLHLMLEVSEQWEFKDLIASHGYQAGIRFLDSDVTIADAEICNALDIDLGSQILVVRKIFTADETPAIFSVNMLSLEVATQPHDLEAIKGPIFHYLAEAYGVHPAYSSAEITPVVPTDELAGYLELGSKAGLLLLKDIFFDAENHVIMYAHNYYTNILHFKAIRQPARSWM